MRACSADRIWKEGERTLFSLKMSGTFPVPLDPVASGGACAGALRLTASSQRLHVHTYEKERKKVCAHWSRNQGHSTVLLIPSEQVLFCARRVRKSPERWGASWLSDWRRCFIRLPGGSNVIIEHWKSSRCISEQLRCCPVTSCLVWLDHLRRKPKTQWICSLYPVADLPHQSLSHPVFKLADS